MRIVVVVVVAVVVVVLVAVVIVVECWLLSLLGKRGPPWGADEGGAED